MPILSLALLLPQEPPTVVVARDDVRIETSCRIRVAAEVLGDAGAEGVLHVVGDGITVDFTGSHLRGAPASVAPDRYAGVGILVTGRGVTLRGVRVSGYRCAVRASGADALVIEGADVSDNFRQRLRSTPRAEDPVDWLRPHENDDDQWLSSYGAGIWIEDSRGVTVRGSRARDVQNGLVLDRVEGARVFDNDFSFLSGWGLALWRSSGNLVSRNAFDFCVRGYSHGVYNRGQDSAGILMFEQCSDNVIAENSATHGGDGFFGFAGREALGEVPPPPHNAGDFDYAQRGNDDNLLVGNDFSYAAAHGIELTFSFGNRLVGNRLVENAICGVWGGYSQDMLIAENRITRNGEAGYGLERGGIDIEHGKDVTILRNEFEGNLCGIHLWWDEDPQIAGLPWARANDPTCSGNRIVGNRFVGDRVAVQVRDCEGPTWSRNRMEKVGTEIDATEGSMPRFSDGTALPDRPREEYEAIGRTRPVGARPHLRGRDKILMTQWGPYDWEGPFLRLAADEGGAHTWELLGDHALQSHRVLGPVEAQLSGGRIRVRPRRAESIAPYTLSVRTAGGTVRREAVLTAATWRVTVFDWSTDPREDAQAWRAEAEGGVTFEVPVLDLPFAMGGPSQLPGAPEEVALAGLRPDRFGTIARTEVSIPAGRWRVKTRSDDGIRVWVDGSVVIDDWTWHAPREAVAELELPSQRIVAIRVEHFELDGYALLSLEIEPLDGR